MLLFYALDQRRFSGCSPRGLEIPAEEMKALDDGKIHITAVLGHHRWLPKWDVQEFLQPSGLLASRRRNEIEQSLQHYGDWRAITGEVSTPVFVQEEGDPEVALISSI
ncbi:hypothetical protein [Deinococcus radiotolerans]|uniref:hypothetical protein n=1 Tax=Deinococcus radiotolerans TaxID=1309407 RepID=UPI00166C866B|nr:hypothetical protein [Deinococcus radiotolerans]